MDHRSFQSSGLRGAEQLRTMSVHKPTTERVSKQFVPGRTERAGRCILQLDAPMTLGPPSVVHLTRISACWADGGQAQGWRSTVPGGANFQFQIWEGRLVMTNKSNSEFVPFLPSIRKGSLSTKLLGWSQRSLCGD